MGDTLTYEKIPLFEPCVHASSMSLRRIGIRSMIVFVVKKWHACNIFQHMNMQPSLVQSDSAMSESLQGNLSGRKGRLA